MIEAAEAGGVVAVPRLNTGSNIEVAKPQTFYGAVSEVLEFLMVCKLFIRMKMREVAVEEQI